MTGINPLDGAGYRPRRRRRRPWRTRTAAAAASFLFVLGIGVLADETAAWGAIPIALVGLVLTELRESGRLLSSTRADVGIGGTAGCVLAVVVLLVGPGLREPEPAPPPIGGPTIEQPSPTGSPPSTNPVPATHTDPPSSTTLPVPPPGIEKVESVAWSADGDWVASGGHDRQAWLWPVDGGTLGTQVAATDPGTSDVKEVAFRPNADQLAVAYASGRVVLVDVTDPTRPGPARDLPPVSPESGDAGITAASFSPDGTQLAVARVSGRVDVWPLDEDGAAGGPRSLSGHVDDVKALAFSPDGRLLVTGGEDTSVRTWDVTDDTTRPTVVGEMPGEVTAVGFVGARSVVAASKQDAIWVIPLDEPAATTALRGIESDVQALVVLDGGAGFATAHYAGYLRLWRLDDGGTPSGSRQAAPGATSSRENDAIVGVASDPTSGQLVTGAIDGSIVTWSVSDDSAGEPSAPVPLSLAW